MSMQQGGRPAGRAANQMPFHKYRAFPPIDLPDRQWPSRVLTAPPRWCSVDLRDGNQALIDPMSPEEKLRMYELLLEVGFGEIEVGFPAASQPDFDFIRQIIDEDRIPDGGGDPGAVPGASGVDRAHGGSPARRAGRHLPLVQLDLDAAAAGRVQHERAGHHRSCGRGHEDGARRARRSRFEITFEYSPESFTGTELPFAVDICAAVEETWGASADAPMIINLPATVEMSTPNVYADQIEWFDRNFPKRDHIVISLHTHNDRGTGVAATELGILAGAQRVEGTLFGNGERTGNCDIVTMAMNMFSQGVDPELDFREMPKDSPRPWKRSTSCPCTERQPVRRRSRVHGVLRARTRTPSRKGMALVDTAASWEVPYLPIDPADVGSSYKETVRVNSQSGKGGVGFHSGGTPRHLPAEGHAGGVLGQSGADS